MPIEGAGVRIKRVSTVMLGNNDYQIMVTREFATNVDWVIRNIQRLSIHLAVHSKIEFQPKRTRVNVAWRQREFVRIPARPRIVVMVGQNIRGAAGIDENNKQR